MFLQKRVIPQALLAECTERVKPFGLTFEQETKLIAMAANYAMDHTLKGKWQHPNYENLARLVKQS